MREIFSFSENSLIASASRKRMMKSSFILLWIYPWMKAVISGVQYKLCAPLEIAVSSAWSNHEGQLCAGMPSST